MHRRYNLVRLILSSIAVLVLAPLMVDIDAQAQIVFTSNRDGHAHAKNGWPTTDIFVMDVDGSNQQNLTNSPRYDRDPSWSPDGKRIAFMSDRDGHVRRNGLPSYEIYVMDADGGNPQNLTNSPRYDRDPSWSPDGKRIAFASDRDEPFGYFDIYVMNADGSNPQRLTENSNNDKDPSWSSDGKRIVFSARRDGHFENEFAITYEIYVMDTDGKNQQRLTNNRKNDWDPVWSPDGERIAFAADRKGDFENFEIYVMDADGKNQQRLTNNRVWDMYPSWSPDGERIAFATDRKGDFENFEIYVMDADGGNQQRLTNNRHSDTNPAWFNSPFSVSPAGKKFTMLGWFKQLDR